MAVENPFELFEYWFEKAKKNKLVKYPDAMNLATVSDDGQALRTALCC